MKVTPVQPLKPTARPEVKRVLLEGVLVVVAGAVFAFAANEVSPRGLNLTRNYFPGDTRTAPPALTTGAVADSTLPGRAPPPGASQGDRDTTAAARAELLAARLKAKGLQVVDHAKMAQLFHDPRYAQELVVFIDARDDRHYQAGHIPGAYQFDHYRAENYFASVLPVCQTASEIMVYCGGGDCEDSEFAAVFLRNAGIPNEKLFVYAGGMAEWTTNHLPVEVGARRSGNISTTKP